MRSRAAISIVFSTAKKIANSTAPPIERSSSGMLPIIVRNWRLNSASVVVRTRCGPFSNSASTAAITVSATAPSRSRIA
ncbi:MAG: hypothetical protein FJ265_22025 [Planctomycetes bacterium]|nr:hypothetical protein [Planctomycetota bacterium]